MRRWAALSTSSGRSMRMAPTRSQRMSLRRVSQSLAFLRLPACRRASATRSWSCRTCSRSWMSPATGAWWPRTCSSWRKTHRRRPGSEPSSSGSASTGRRGRRHHCRGTPSGCCTSSACTTRPLAANTGPSSSRALPSARGRPLRGLPAAAASPAHERGAASIPRWQPAELATLGDRRSSRASRPPPPAPPLTSSGRIPPPRRRRPRSRRCRRHSGCARSSCRPCRSTCRGGPRLRSGASRATRGGRPPQRRPSSSASATSRAWRPPPRPWTS
mmetsp:Transcript_70267/g.209447  ORF Transcript_70267/g.209447 Transcript_70267/m.209447 type:complete len:273 (+) Transcript_70267:534-1352(+)